MDLSKQIERMAQERDHFRDSYARKLGEHAETLLHCLQLCEERDEARAKLAEFGVVTRCQNCGGTGKDARGSDCCRIPGHAKECACFMCQWKNAFYILEREANEERAKLAATEAHVATLRAALTTLRRWVNTCHHPERLEECGFCRETGRIDEALAATPAECAERLRVEAGREVPQC